MSPTTADGITNSWLGQIPAGQVVVFLIVIGGFVYWAWRSGRKLHRVTAPLENFLRDWNGEPARPGVTERPGVMSRLKTIEDHTKDAPTRSEFNALVQQVTANTAVVELIKPHVMLVTPTDGESAS